MITDPNWISAITSVAMLIITVTSSAAQIARLWKRLQRRKGQSLSTTTAPDTTASHTEQSRRQWFFRNGTGFAAMAAGALVWLLATGWSDAQLTRKTALLMSALTVWLVLSLLMTALYAAAAALAPKRWLDASTH